MPRNGLCLAVIALLVSGAWGTAFSPLAADAAAPQRGQAAPTVITQRIVGSWELTMRTVRRGNAAIADPVLGQQPIGRLFYDATGRMMLQMMRQGRTAAISQPANREDAANPRVVLGYDAYFGTYTINEGAGTITHRVEASLFPEDLGKDFVRRFALDGDTLTLSFTSQAPDGSEMTRTLTFRRAK